MVVSVSLFTIGKDLGEPAEIVAFGYIQHRVGVADDTGRQQLVGRFVVENADPELHEIVAALGPPGGLPRGLDGRQEQRDQDRR